jgi:serine protease Do
MRQIFSKRKGLAVLMLAAGLLAGVLLTSGVKAAHAADGIAAPDATPLKVPDPVQLSNTFSQLAKQLEPSVVQVTSTVEEKATRNRTPRGFMPFDDDGGDMFQRFFGGQMPQQRPRREQGTGSGFIVDRNGYILTNNHVVDGASKVQVKLHDASNLYTAKIIGTDPELDLAVIKIDAGHSLTPVRVGNSDAVQVGDWSMAIGSPFGLEATVTAGIISAKGRDLMDNSHQLQRFLQTDAAINPGNSGGPLLNIRGEVIGVNTMILTGSGHFEGIGFALPINLAVNAYNQIIKTGKVSRGAIGINFQREQKPELLKVYGVDHGVFVSQVNPGGPAAKAGIKEQDVITEFNGKPVKDGEALVAMVSETPVGAKVPVRVVREGKAVNLTLEIGDRSEIIAGNAGPDKREPSDNESAGQPVKFGISVQNLTVQEKQTLKLQGGAAVAGVDEGSFAEDIGLREGDIITAINREPVNTAADVRRIAGTLKAGDAVAFKALRLAPDGSAVTFYAAGTLPH